MLIQGQKQTKHKGPIAFSFKVKNDITEYQASSAGLIYLGMGVRDGESMATRK